MFNFTLVEPPKSTCKGAFWRVKESKYLDSKGNIVSKKSYSLLKRMSCKGCHECGWILDDLRESDYNFIDDVSKDGDIITFDVCNESRDWESGIIDDWDLKVVVIK